MDTRQQMVAQPPAIVVVALGLQPALCCELGALDASPTPSPSLPSAPLNGNLLGGRLQLSLRKTVSTLPGATDTQDATAMGAAVSFSLSARLSFSLSLLSMSSL